MKLLEVLGVALLGLGLAAATFPDCPRHCACTQSSFSGSRARCTYLDTQVQSFPPDMAHLVVENYPDERLPSKIFADLGLDGLLTIRLTNGSLKHIDKDAFAGLTYLEDLDLSYNKIERLDPHTFETIRLRRLNMNGNPLGMYDPQAPKEKRHFLYADSLVELTLANGKISKLEDVQALSKLDGLEFLDLSGNRLTELKDDMFSTLINLEEINLSNNLIKHIDRDTFTDIDELTALNLRGNPLRTLEGIESDGLKSLDASDCNIEMLTASTLEGFPDLSSLNLSQNSIMSIDMDTFMNVPYLKDLDLSYNKLRGPLSSLMFEFNKKLETLSFQGNSEIKFMPGFKGDFPYLYRYDISKCGLTGISNDTFKGMEFLVSLNLSGNALVHIEPMTFSNLPNLIELDISSNLLHGLNSKLFHSNRELSKLYLSNNYFKHLSAALFQPVPKLHSLDVSNCRLISLWNISESFMMRNRNVLSKLTRLNLSGNNLTKLHTHYFISLVNLQKLDISNNPIQCTPDFSHVMQWLIMKKVVPNKDSTEKPVSLDLIENNVQWDEILRAVCPLDLTKYRMDTISSIPVRQAGHVINAFPTIDNTDGILNAIPVRKAGNVINAFPAIDHTEEVLNAIPVRHSSEERVHAVPVVHHVHHPVTEFDDQAKEVTVPILEETPLVWPMVLVWASIFSLLFALANIIGLLIYRSRRNYKILGIKPHFASTLDGHFQVRRGDGRPVYQKLYEECSAPVSVHSQNKLGPLFGRALGKGGVDV